MTYRVPTIILNLQKWDKVTWTKRIKYGISKSAKKQSIFPNPAHKSICRKIVFKTYSKNSISKFYT